MNFENYIKGTRATHGNDPAENIEESSLCLNCQMDLTFEEIQEELKNCLSCTEEIEEEKKNK